MLSKVFFSDQGSLKNNISQGSRGKGQDDPGILWCQKSSTCSETGGDISKGHRSQHEGAPNGQYWDNLSNKTNSDSNGLLPKE